ncbi:MAG: hypothetical protein EXQ74_06505 [Thermoleophilia bacterium]|nr:hypothetical protein [Thermoleophilia bacterium]
MSTGRSHRAGRQDCPVSISTVVVQLIGFAGYGLLLAATLARRRLRLLTIDAVGGGVLVLHWALLGAVAGVTMNALYSAVDIAGFDPRSRRGRVALAMAMPVSIILVAVFWKGPSDLLAGAGLLFAIASRASSSQLRLRTLGMIGCIPWGIFGVVHGSISQVIFSAIYFVAMGVSIVRIARDTPTSGTAAEDPGILPADGTR